MIESSIHTPAIAAEILSQSERLERKARSLNQLLSSSPNDCEAPRKKIETYFIF
ncbi:hypothetical protein LEP1GSC199_0090 [Leptospira vanthielii serovar Holland str. Waz Holland = ATCC 700522]|uniref:Uncharacterized protein n=1 Tax=Leptospira vanthielii serovar Holland str. Waz Holland = ATCC 700522 TaxID=1218591 RepID=N1WA19_9LEPT|nr:hypothetical protein LEP1GSC199_0090 [Leptospira vanthielii serovar Holland str. Waz Holland = ATCC 700522]